MEWNGWSVWSGISGQFAPEYSFSHRAAKAYRAFPEDVRRRIKPKIDALAENPRPRGARKIEGEETAYRDRVGDYRIVYEVHDRVFLVLVMNVGHRREVYRRT